MWTEITPCLLPLSHTLSSCLLKSQQPISLPPRSFYQHNLHCIYLSCPSTFLLLDILTTAWNCWNFNPFDYHPNSFTNLQYQVFWCKYILPFLLHSSSCHKPQHSTYYWHTYYPLACYPALQPKWPTWPSTCPLTNLPHCLLHRRF